MWNIYIYFAAHLQDQLHEVPVQQLDGVREHGIAIEVNATLICNPKMPRSIRYFVFNYFPNSLLDILVHISIPS